MTVWKFPLSHSMVQRSMIAALSAALLMTPLHALAADEAPQAETSPTKTPSSTRPTPRLPHKSRGIQPIPWRLASTV